jgi:hypothetical protein
LKEIHITHTVMTSNTQTIPQITIDTSFDNNNTLCIFECSHVPTISNNFGSCSMLTTVILPSTTNVNGAFNSCTSLTSIEFNTTQPEKNSTSNTSLEQPMNTVIIASFRNCSGLVQINLPFVTSISSSESGNSTNGSFNGCTSLTNVTLTGVTSIRDSFISPTALLSLILPVITNISNSFISCGNLLTLHIPSIMTLSNNSFGTIVPITSTAGNPYAFTKINFIIFNKDTNYDPLTNLTSSPTHAQIDTTFMKWNVTNNNGVLMFMDYEQYLQIQIFTGTSNLLTLNITPNDLNVYDSDYNIINNTYINYISLSATPLSNIKYIKTGTTYSFSYGGVSSIPSNVTYFNKVSSCSNGDVADTFIAYTLNLLKTIGINKTFRQVSNINTYKNNLVASMNRGMNDIIGSSTVFSQICDAIYANMLSDTTITLQKRLIPTNANDDTIGSFKLIPGDILQMKLRLKPGNDLSTEANVQTYNIDIVITP